MKKIVIILIFLCVIGGVYFGIMKNHEAAEPVGVTTTDEKLTVEQYIRDNIKTLATDKPALGGAWYVTKVEIDPATKTGTVAYEDGHIESKAAFSYSIVGDKVSIVWEHKS